jgi:hypothetical protein
MLPCASALLQLFEPTPEGMGYGDLLFTDPTTKRFIHVQVDPFGSESLTASSSGSAMP